MPFSIRGTRKAIAVNYPDVEVESGVPLYVERSISAIESGDAELPEWLKEELFWERLERLKKAEVDESYRQSELEKCRSRDAESVIYWINNWVWTQDPRIPGASIVPFVLFPKQEEYIRWRRERRKLKQKGLVRKSRDAGLTWLNCADQAHSFIFETAYKGAFGSRKELLVDRKDDPDSIFEKLRILIKCLPFWMREGIKDSHLGYLKLVNPNNGSCITGEAGDNIGRGGRNAVYDIDEASYVVRSEKADASLSQNCPTIIKTSTPNIWDPFNTFDRAVQKKALPIFHIYWRSDPRKDQEWYDEQVRTLDPVIVATEIDGDVVTANDRGIIPAAWIRAAMDRWQDRKLRYDYIGVDVSRGGSDLTVIAGRAGHWVDRLRTYPGSLTPDGDIVARRVVAAISGMPESAMENIDWGELYPYVQSYLSEVRIDVVGVGAAPFDLLKSLRVKRLFGLSGGERSVDAKGRYKTDRTGRLGFYNRRAEWWWHLRELLDPAHDSMVELPPDEELAVQLATPKWAPVPVTDPTRIKETDKQEERIMALIRLESKESKDGDGIKARLGVSPDLAEAVVYAFADVEFKPPKAEWLKKL